MTDEHDETEDLEQPEGVTVQFSRGGGKRGRRGSGDESDPIMSDVHIPMFPDFDKDVRHVVHALEVYKLTAPNEGFRGALPPTATFETIGKMFGDGRYRIHAVTESGKVLRRIADQPIAVNATTGQVIARPAAPQMSADMTLLDFQAKQHEKDAERVATFAKESNQQNREMTEKHLKMVEDMHTSQIARDREFFGAQNKSQQDFFAGILAMMDKSHTYTMQQVRESNAYMLQMMEQGHQRAMALSDPTLLLSLFREGMETGRDMGDGMSDNPVIQGIGMGLEGLREVKQMMFLKNGQGGGRLGPKRLNSAKTDPAKHRETRPQPSQNPRETAPASDGRAVIPKLVALKSELEARGINLEEYLDDALARVAASPKGEEDGTEDGGHSEQSDDGPGTPGRGDDAT